jgi:hemoglobin/transferrin/lactoferrin receptor protein
MLILIFKHYLIICLSRCPMRPTIVNRKKFSLLAKATTLIAIQLYPFASVQIANASEKSELEEVIITATRTEKLVSEIAGTVSIIDAKQIEDELANGIDDLIRYEPGVSVSGGGRFGLNSFSIRGVGGDRVLTLVDSTPTADEFSFGPFLSSRRDFVDIDALKSVEIVRGPGSSVYGSTAIGGVVNFITKQPIDYLQGNSIAGSAKVGFSSVDSSTNTTFLSAFGNETLSALVLGTLREGSENETFFNDNLSGPDRRSQNPQDTENKNIYAKVVYAPNDKQSLSLVAERFVGESDTDVLSVAGTSSRGVVTNQQSGLDERTRQRFSLEYSTVVDAGLFDSAQLLAYIQKSDASQDTLTERVSLGVVQDRVRTSFFDQDNVGFRAQLAKTIEFANSEHNIIYGVDYDRSESETLREGSTIVRLDGSPVREFSNFPTRDFPNSEYTSLGVFLQDDISLLDGRLNIIPSLRYDSFELSPTTDPIYLSGNTGSPTPEGYDESELSAKLGVVYKISDEWSGFAQYAQGFRAPPLDAVNTGFTNFAGGYTTLPNPDLRPEQGESFELGFRRFSEGNSIEIAIFDNRYTDFIEGLAVRGFNPLTGLLEFQARNLDQAEIKGVELKARYQLGAVNNIFQGVNLRAAYAYSEGENKENGTPLNSVNPQELVLGIGYLPSSERWSLEAVITAADRKDANDIDSSSLQTSGQAAVVPFETPGYAVLDLIGHYNINDKLKINWGVYNAMDKQVYQWSEEFLQDPLTTNFERLTQPGRNYSVTAKYTF